MAIHISWMLALLIFHLVKYVTADCQAHPVAVPITEVVLPNKQKVRGALVSAGTPAQDFSLLINSNQNNTYLWDQAQCSNLNQSISYCISYRGGLLNYSSSTSWSTMGSYAAAGAPSDDADGTKSKSKIGLDTMVINSIPPLDKFPFGIFAHLEGLDGPVVTHFENSLGLGPNSSLLTRLKESGVIRSNSWSLWWGSAGAAASDIMNGTLVFGGYDKAKTIGNNITFDLATPSCPSGLVVTASQILLNLPEGQDIDILKGIPMAFCVATDFPGVISLPSTQFNNLLQATDLTWAGPRSGGPMAGTAVFNANQNYDGDLTMVLSSDFRVRIPNKQLVRPDQVYLPDGTVTYNSSLRNVLVFPADNPYIGRQFFTAAMVMVDWDNKKFTLWQANPTTDVELVPYPNGAADASCQPSPSSSNLKAGLGAGTVAGIVVGSLAGIIVAMGALCYFFRKRHQPLPSEETREAVLQHDGEPTSSEIMTQHYYQLDAGPKEPLELESGRYSPIELSTHER